MTARVRRIYPARVTATDLALHKLSLEWLTRVNRCDLSGLVATCDLLSHRIACAERWAETRAKRLTEFERKSVTGSLLAMVNAAVDEGMAEDARANARALVRITRDPA